MIDCLRARERGVAARATRLDEDQESWPALRLTVVDPWKELAGIWSADTPEWVRILDHIAATPHETDDFISDCPPERSP
jgi:hypothetical protein